MSVEEKVFKEIDARSKVFIERLRESVAIPSVSAEAARRKDVFRMIDWTEKVCLNLYS
jgi:Cys-Gly metallodipeptidase DUG1